MTNWENLEKFEKRKIYEENYCNELNFFIFIRDQEIFKEYVEEVIKNKFEKQLIDYYMLNDIENLKKFAIFENIN